MFAVSLENYDRLVSRIYEAALDRSRWQVFVDDLAHVVGGSYAALHAHDFEQHCNLGAITTHDPDFMATYRAHYASVNAWVPTLATMPVGAAQQPETFFARERLLKTEFYNDWLRPQGILTAAGIVLHRDRNRFLALAVDIEGDSEERTKAPALELLNQLAPHLGRAFDLIRQLSGQGVDVLFEDTLEAIPTATFLVDRRGRLTRANALGEALLGGGHTLKLDGDRRLAFADALAQGQVDMVLEAMRRGQLAHIGASFSVRGEPGAAPMQASIVPFRPASAFDQPPFSILTDTLPAAVLAVSQPPAAGSLDRLSARFGLSPAERRVAEALCSGSTLRDYAEERGVSIHTARNQLKSLMAKAGVARQSQLVALFAAPLPATQ